MKFPFSYNLSPSFEPTVFWQAVSTLDDFCGSWAQESWEDPLDGDLFKRYSSGHHIIEVRCDWDIGAVFVDSTILLECLLEIRGD